MDFLGKKVFVTGGTSGIGHSIALHFVQQGASVAILGTDEDRARSVIQEMDQLKRDASQQLLFFVGDVSQTAEVERMANQLLSEWSIVDILVNNAGIVCDQLLIRMSEADWDRVIDVNLKSIYNTCHVLIRPMMKQRSGKVINISSVIGLTGNAGQTNYAASKAGIIGFTKSLALELAGRNICVNCVAPGFVQTHMTENLTPAVKESILARIPLGRMGSADEIAQVVLFLASPHADYITGQVITVDGGMVMHT